jgi:phosphatidylserine/phosphatidylglycerophosphate/cardiolipin synthase-like enzyme
MTRTRRRRWPLLAAALLLLAAMLWRHDSRGAGGAVAAVAALPATEPAGAAGDEVVVEPDDGMARIDTLLASPRRSLDLVMYELSDPTAETILADDAARGVRVRVLLDHRLEGTRNAPAYDFLRSRGVTVVWSSSRYFATHEKSFVVDGRTAVVMSLNLTSRYYATTRDVAVVDRDLPDVTAFEDVFAADLRGASVGTPAADDLVWSPGQSEADLLALLRSARRSVAVESEELSSEVVVAALVDAARRGVSVRLVMTDQPKWQPAFDRLLAAGAQVAVMHGESPLYIHAKLLVVDAGTASGRVFVGSENLSPTSLQRDRELGLVLLDPASVQRLRGVIDSDYADGAALAG